MAKSNPRISVIIVTYNQEHYIGECIESILSQTLNPFEIVICDDHSVDNTRKIFMEYHSNFPSLIKVFRQKKNVGSVENSQLGRQVYRGDYVSVIEGDDLWFPEKLEVEWDALKQNTDAMIAYSGVIIIDEKGNKVRSWTRDDNKYPISDVFIEVYSKKFFSNTRSVFRNQLMYRKVFDEEGYCDKSLESYWDWDMKVRMTNKYKVAYSGQHVVAYRRHSAGFSLSEPMKHLKAFVRVYEKHLPLLKSRPFSESIYVKANLETYIAKKQYSLFKTDDLNYYSHRNVYRTNQSSLKKISNKNDQAVKKELSQLLSKFITKSIKQDLRKGNRTEALKSWFFFFMNNIKNPLSYKLLKKIIGARKSNK